MTSTPKNNKIFYALIFGGILFLAVGAPGVSKDPVVKAYDRCVSAKQEHMGDLVKIGLSTKDDLQELIQTACSSLRSFCENDRKGDLCELFINKTYEQFKHD